MNYLVYKTDKNEKHQKMSKNGHENCFEYKVMSLIVLYCPTNSPNHKNTEFTQQFLHWRSFKWKNFGIFFLENLNVCLNTYLTVNSCCLIFGPLSDQLIISALNNLSFLLIVKYQNAFISQKLSSGR